MLGGNSNTTPAARQPQKGEYIVVRACRVLHYWPSKFCRMATGGAPTHAAGAGEQALGLRGSVFAGISPAKAPARLPRVVPKDAPGKAFSPYGKRWPPAMLLKTGKK
jgi:hypothetical protein